MINCITQTPDGYLWLGTEFGLLRFDGVRNVPWQPPAGRQLPSNNIGSLLVSRDGTLWIGTWKGLVSWKDDRLTEYPELAGQIILTLLEDREGTIWAGEFAFNPPGGLCAIRNGGVRCYGRDGVLGNGALAMHEDAEGNLWVGVRTGLWRWKPGPPRFYPLAGEPNGIQGMAEMHDGGLLIALGGRVARLTDGNVEPEYPFPGGERQFHALRLLRDSDGGLWIGTMGGGLVHVHQGRTDVFAQSDGLSGDSISALFEDHEGSVWVATTGGLDRFRSLAVATFSVHQGLSGVPSGAVLAAKDGSLWLGTYHGLSEWSDGRTTVYGESSTSGSAQRGRVREIAVQGLRSHELFSLFQDDRGRIWVAANGGIGYLEKDRFVPVAGVPGGIVYSIAEDNRKNLWIANLDLGLLRLTAQGSTAQRIPWSRLGHRDPAMALAADSVQGGLWLGFFQGGVAYLRDGQIRASYGVADGLGGGVVNGLQFDHEGNLWAATEGGLSRLKNGRVATLNSKNGLPCDAVLWAQEDDQHALWLNMACNLVRIPRTELDSWASAAEQGKDSQARLQPNVFDSSDGVRSSAFVGSFSPPVAESPDGKLWFTTLDGLSVVDPQHLPFNKIPPPVHIEQIIARRKVYDLSYGEKGELRLPALTRDLEIDYTALSLVAPEKTAFRYKLEGWDHDWQEVGGRRQAFYNNLPPGSYRFRVVASNNSGVWNDVGESVAVSIAPAYYQAYWFQALCVVVFFGLGGGLYRLRLRQISRQLAIRMEERIEERTRIAQELHDTLLQEMLGASMLLNVANEGIASDSPLKPGVQRVLELMTSAVEGGRNAVRGLRLAKEFPRDLGQAFSRVPQELAVQNVPEFRLLVEGSVRALRPAIHDQVYMIGREAIANAFRHSHASSIEVVLQYNAERFGLVVRDNGGGIDPKVMRFGRDGHFGLTGMRERAERIGGQLRVFSGEGIGTEVELVVAGQMAYASQEARSWLRRLMRPYPGEKN
jgi:signal transduction histidine kinase/ligand-binding sensor domain-containing protein